MSHPQQQQRRCRPSKLVCVHHDAPQTQRPKSRLVPAPRENDLSSYASSSSAARNSPHHTTTNQQVVRERRTKLLIRQYILGVVIETRTALPSFQFPFSERRAQVPNEERETQRETSRKERQNRRAPSPVPLSEPEREERGKTPSSKKKQDFLRSHEFSLVLPSAEGGMASICCIMLAALFIHPSIPLSCRPSPILLLLLRKKKCAPRTAMASLEAETVGAPYASNVGVIDKKSRDVDELSRQVKK